MLTGVARRRLVPLVMAVPRAGVTVRYDRRQAQCGLR